MDYLNNMSPKFRISITHYPKLESTVINYFRFYFTPDDIKTLEDRGVLYDGPSVMSVCDYCLKSLVRRKYIRKASVRSVPFDSIGLKKCGDTTVFEFSGSKNDGLENQFYKAKDVEEENTDYYDPKDPRKRNDIYYANCLLANAAY